MPRVGGFGPFPNFDEGRRSGKSGENTESEGGIVPSDRRVLHQGCDIDRNSLASIPHNPIACVMVGSKSFRTQGRWGLG